MSNAWDAGFIECFRDIKICLLGACCACYLFGQNAEKIDGSNKIKMCVLYSLTGGFCPCLVHTSRRKKLRLHYDLVENPKDFWATCYCTSCFANCQEAQELNKRGVPDGGRMGGPVARQPQ